MALAKRTATNKQVVQKKKVRKAEESQYFNKTCTTPRGILSYPTLHEPRLTADGKEQYSCDIFVSKEDMASPQGEKFLSVIDECLEFYGLDKDDCDHFPIVDMDEENDCPEFAQGTYRIRAKNKLMVPTVIDRKKINLTEDEVKAIKGGDIGKINVSPFKYNWKGNISIGLGLEVVMFIEGGEPLGGGSMARIAAIDDMEVEEVEDADIEDGEDDTEFED